MNLKAKIIPFYIFIFGFFLLMIGPYLLSHGMFMDGIIYATVSNNLANGIGSMTDLAFTETCLTHFREHPPLAFWIQSVVYKIFGDSFIIEKIYSAATYIITGIIIRKIWIRLTDMKSLAWLPLLFWISIPIITQAARNNLLENTMMIFTTWALYFLIRDKDQMRIASLILAGFSIYLGFMTKGFVALFLWSFPFWAFVLRRNVSFLNSIKNGLLLILFTFIPFVLLSLIYPESYTYLSDYFDAQVANSLLKVQTVDSRFWIIKKLLKELITPMILVIIILIVNRILNGPSITHTRKKTAWLILLVGFSGVFPIMISLKQSGFYSIPAFALLSISFALLLKDNVEFIYQKINAKNIAFKIFRMITAASLMVSFFIVFSNYGKNGRDSQKLNDITKIANKIGNYYYLEGDYEIPKDWTVLAYFYRYHKINIVPTNAPSGQYYLSLNNAINIPGLSRNDTMNLEYFNLYE